MVVLLYTLQSVEEQVVRGSESSTARPFGSCQKYPTSPDRPLHLPSIAPSQCTWQCREAGHIYALAYLPLVLHRNALWHFSDTRGPAKETCADPRDSLDCVLRNFRKRWSVVPTAILHSGLLASHMIPTFASSTHPSCFGTS